VVDAETASRGWFWLVAFDGDEASGARVRRGGEDEPIGAQQLIRGYERFRISDDEAGELEALGPGVVKGEGHAGGQVGQEGVDLVAFGSGGEGVDEGSEELLEGHAGLLRRVSARTGVGSLALVRVRVVPGFGWWPVQAVAPS